MDTTTKKSPRVRVVFEVRSDDEGLEGCFDTQTAAQRYCEELSKIGVVAHVATRLIHDPPPLVIGGQGRSAADVVDSAWAIVSTVAIAAATFAVLWFAIGGLL